VTAHGALVHAIAVNIHSKLPVHVELCDLVQEGMRGLIDAARRYDPRRGVAFTRTRSTAFGGHPGWTAAVRSSLAPLFARPQRSSIERRTNWPLNLAARQPNLRLQPGQQLTSRDGPSTTKQTGR